MSKTSTTDRTALKDAPNITTKIHAYRFDVGNDKEAREYRAMCERLEGLGLRLVAFLNMERPGQDFQREHINPLDGQTVTLECRHIFDDQWNSAPTPTSEIGLRLHDWTETIYRNRHLKVGYWLEPTDEMAAIRRDVLKCGYCGAHYWSHDRTGFCDSCLDSPYLKESDLHLLRLIPAGASFKTSREPLTEQERVDLLPVYTERQTTGSESRAVQQRERERTRAITDHDKTVTDARVNRDGILWFLDRHLSTENLIYYSHTGRFCLGWRSPLSPELAETWREKCQGFPFPLDFKTD